MRQALHCHRLTKLITLQIHFLNTGQNTMLINLGRHRLMDCLIALPRFYQVSKEGNLASILSPAVPLMGPNGRATCLRCQG